MTEIDPKRIRNFCIIAHIDHGKSTLADRILEKTGLLSQRQMREQFLDKMDIERERGITIKAQTVQLHYRAKDGKTYLFHLVDTPGHVDFSYEVSRALRAAEGALLIVDATQGVEAQTVANVYLALEQGLEILPVINKIDLPAADPSRVLKEIDEVIGLVETDHAIEVSAKEGIGINALLEKIVSYFSPPKGNAKNPLKALIFDSWFDPYRGVIALCRVLEGVIQKGKSITLYHRKKTFEVLEVGVLAPELIAKEKLVAGEIGVVICGIKNISDFQVGDTLFDPERPLSQPLPGFQEMKPMVFCGLYPIEGEDYPKLREALGKLKLNDASLSFEPETSLALGFGFRCGFLGLLHMEVTRERLEREFSLALINTAPSVAYKVVLKNKSELFIENPSQLPDPSHIEDIEEPIMQLTLHTPPEYVGALLQLCTHRRGIQKNIHYFSEKRVQIVYDLPLQEMVFDFYDQLKTLSRGYASMDYEWKGYQKSFLVRLDVLVNGEKVDALSVIVPKEKAYRRGKELVSKLKEVINRQLFEVIIQASIGAKIVARERIAPLRKQVTAKCYGGDITRKRKLLEKQKEGKKRMKQIGKIEIPQEAFLAVLKLGGD